MSISSRITAMEEHISNAYDKIEDLGIDTTNINKNINNISSILETVWDEQSKVLGQGTDIVLKNIRTGKMKLDRNGRTEQEQLKGVNLTEHDEVTFPLSSDVLCDFGDGRTFSKLSFTLICNNNTFTYGGAAFILYVDGNDTEKYLTLNTFKVPSNPVNGTFTYSVSNVTVKKIRLVNWSVMTGTIKLQIQEGEPTAWEPYTNGLATPNLNYTEPIKNVTGNTNVKIPNKNLFNPNGEFENGVYGLDGVFAPNDSWRCTTIKCKQGDIFTRSGGTWGGNVTFWKNNVFISGINSSSAITIPSGVNEVKFACRYPFSGDEQLEYGTTATSYVEHQEQNYPFTFAEGQFLADNEKLQDNGMYKKWKKKIFDGTESWYAQVFSGGVYYYTKIADGSGSIALCSHFINIDSSIAYTIPVNQFAYSGNTTKNILFNNGDTEDKLTEWKALLAQQYANGTPVIVEYKLETEEIIPYNETQQAQYNAIKQARSYDDMTIISSESDELGFDMNVVGLEKSVNQVLGGSY